jgi:hypothetical protein
MKKVWHDNIGDSWAVPPDGRIELSFQEHVLERLGSETTEWLKALRLFNRQLSKLNGRISDKYRHPFVIVDMYWKPGKFLVLVIPEQIKFRLTMRIRRESCPPFGFGNWFLA